MSFTPDSAEVGDVRPSANVEPRRGGRQPDLLLLHYTGMASAERAIWWLAEPASKVSCHYVIDEVGRITQMVPEALRAWHAGVGRWGVDRDINSCSIGIEIHNPGHELGYTDFPAPQMAAVVRLALDITRRNAIPPERVLAHSDIAPLRKMDPGEKFPWQKLSAAGVGVWAEPVAVEPDDPGYGPGAGGPVVTAAQRRLIAYGYGLEPTGEMDGLTTAVVAAFQRHFRPARVDGRLDGSTVATLERLLAITTSG